jgi:fatty acid desaturase
MSTATELLDRPKVDTPPQKSAYRRILRRETHSSRSGTAIAILIVLLLVAAYVGLEAVYSALGLHPLLFSPTDVLAALLTAATTQGGLVIAAGIASGVLGVVLIIVALTPGRRGRHTIDDARVAVVVDDQVIAASLARRARLAGGLAPGQVNAWVARNSTRITLTRATGTTADEEAVLTAARDDLTTIGYRPAVEPHVRVSDSGRLGA